MNLEIENPATFEQALQTKINLFLGAGFSTLSSDSEKKPLPVGSELATELASHFQINLPGLDLSQLCVVIASSRKRELMEFLEHRFDVHFFDKRYSTITEISVNSIFTTNIDNLIERIFESSADKHINDIDFNGPAYHDRSAVDLVHLHGSITNKHAPLRFGPPDLAAAFAADPDRWHRLTNSIQDHYTLFWGYSVSDAGTLQAIHPITSKGRAHKDKWILVRPTQNASSDVSYFRALGFQTIVGTTSDMLDFLTKQKLNPPEPRSSLIATDKIFPESTIPAPHKIPVRPILSFYLGAAPEWSDIYSGSLYKTSHFNRIKNSLNTGKNVAIIGTPACGKSTALMQLAVEMPRTIHRLMYGSITVQQANTIIRKLNGDKSVIFIDNLQDSIDAIEVLSSAKNIQLVCADRDYNFGLVSRRATGLFGKNIVDISELTDADVQGCLDSIPAGISRKNIVTFKKSNGDQLSLFELIESNIGFATLKSRYRGVLSELQKKDQNLHDTLLLISYIYSCRTPASVDILVAFFRDVTSNWLEIMDLTKKLGSTISEYSDDLGLTDQDYYRPRSTLVADTVVSIADNSALKRMLIRFHKNVSPHRIYRYDIFRRQAYDADLFIRAFPDHKEGISFYHEIYQKHSSPYLLQQAALYLSRKRQHTEAFRTIDRALLESENRSWSIRNSHAIILFRANIDLADKPVSRASLRQSLDQLALCYKWDKKKLFHALTYGDLVIQYYHAYGDNEARDYLRTALGWLSDEQKEAPWHRDIRRLIPAIETLLR